MGAIFASFKSDRRFELNKEFLKLLQTKLEKISKFSLIICVEYHVVDKLFWDPICGTHLKNFLLITKLKEKDMFLGSIFSFILMIRCVFHTFLLLLKQDQKYRGLV